MSTNPWNDLEETLRQTLDEEELTRCMRCGFCLPSCPTYQESGKEAASPRGRIALMKAIHDGKISPDPTFQKQMNYCLGCRACEPACPADVRFGHLLEQSRAAITSHVPTPLWNKLIRRLFFHTLLPHRSRLRIVAVLFFVYQQLGLRTLFLRSGLAKKILPSHLLHMDKALPLASHRGVRERMKTDFHPAHGVAIGRVALFPGCIMDVLFPQTNTHTVQILQAAGYDVILPNKQPCCGALHAHAGEEKKAHQLAKENIDLFLKMDIDWIASNAGGCGAHLIDYPYLLKNSPQWKAFAHSFANRVKDISELILAGRPLTLHPLQQRVTYQSSCHLQNGMKVEKEPLNLLSLIPKIELVELAESERCCGSAGIYNLTHPHTSFHILDEKMERIRHTQANTIVTSNPGCLLQLTIGIHRARLQNQLRALHLIDFLMESMKAETSTDSASETPIKNY
ncbi:(Fe-S)-binding protein [Marininema halotolerans]|uniref:Glycolate oxidase iron-sulfur subunit n=1 Tax=Marininema halotolerans TaxID=1155944 RepID=A0A1I6PTI5_9BACL|nr:(Fe-S)-binding protein [Marininema halotolerans]SFS43496.1 glycolate oxidase iron-sulfur subunit [Marininema halotolerans]